MAKINIYGELYNNTKDNPIVASAAQIIDRDNENQTQSAINTLLLNSINTETGDFYTKSQIDSLINGLHQFHFELVEDENGLSSIVKPEGNVLYLLHEADSGEDQYSEYIFTGEYEGTYVYDSEDFTKIGDTSMDLSSYAQQSDVNEIDDRVTVLEANMSSAHSVVDDASLGKLVISMPDGHGGTVQYVVARDIVEAPEKPRFTETEFYSKNGTITISCGTSDATIRYTVSSGSNPTEPIAPTKDSGQIYNGAIPLNQDTSMEYKTWIFKAVAVKNGAVSEVETKTYRVARELNPVEVALNPANPTNSESCTVTITSSNGANIKYTTDNSDPTTGLSYAEPFVINSNGSHTIKAVPSLDGWVSPEFSVISFVVRKIAEVKQDTLSGTDYTRTRNLKLKCDTSDVTIYYTIDGSIPTSSSNVYTSNGIELTANCTVKAIAKKSGWTDSELFTKSYTVYKKQIHYGASLSSIMSNADAIENLPAVNPKIVNNIEVASGDYTVTIPPSGNYYVWICVPSNITIDIESDTGVTVGGYKFPMLESDPVSPYYRCYRYDGIPNPGNITITVK